MGSEQFQSEYIEYLQSRNAELLDRLAQMKEIYDNKIFSKDLDQHYFISTLMDVLNVCTAVPEEIDTLFDKMSEAMSVLINVLSRKSALIQLGEKITKLLNPSGNEDLIDIQSSEENKSAKTNRKAGTVKVSPMINGHIISTEPRICLNRVSGNHIPMRSESHRLSPILEVNPDVISEVFPNANSHKIKDLRVMSEKLNLNHATYNYINQESPKGRFKGTKIWKKSLSSNMQTQTKKDSHFVQNNEDLEKLDAVEAGQPQSSENDIDPLEGPSWLYDDQKSKSSPKCFIDFRQRRHRYARVFDKDKDISCFKTEKSNTDNTCENISRGEPFNQSDNEAHSKKLISESSLSHLESDQEYTPRTKKRKSLRKRRKCDNRENFDSDLAHKKTSSSRFSNKKEKEDSDISGSSYEGDNEENYSGKCRSTQKPYQKNPLKSSVELESRKSLPRVMSEDLELDCQESQNTLTRSKECLKPVSYDINFLIKEALGREAHIAIEDCMKQKEDLKPEKLSRGRSNMSKSNSKAKSPRMNLPSEKNLSETSIESNLTNQNQRSRRKAAPTNLTEPKLGTKLRRS